jgi:hypothetical protein
MSLRLYINISLHKDMNNFFTFVPYFKEHGINNLFRISEMI